MESAHEPFALHSTSGEPNVRSPVTCVRRRFASGPAPHCRTPVLAYLFDAEPEEHFLNWQQDPHGNFLARLIFPKPTQSLVLTVDLVAELTVINPFDFFWMPTRCDFRFAIRASCRMNFGPTCGVSRPARLQEFLAGVPRRTARERSISWSI